jgi:pimeloyl-ACP methyl ester carboxylesterase
MAIFVVPGFLRQKSFYQAMEAKIKKAGFEIETIDLGRNYAGLNQSADKVWQFLKNVSGQYDLIGHSYGGLILKNLLFLHPEIKKSVKSIAFVSVPHNGSWQALFLSFLPAAREALPFRKRLRELLEVDLPETTVNFISEKELKVWPRKSGLLKNRIDIIIPDTDHDSIITNDNFIFKALEFIKSNYDRIFLG